MKIKTLMAALLLMFGINMMADQYQYLTVSYKDTEHNISLPLVKKIYFENNYLVVMTTDGTNHFPISYMEKISFTESATAIEAMPEQAENLTYKDGTLAVKGDGLLRIFSTNGALVSIANVKEGANISLGNFPTGVYIVRMGDKAIKVSKK